MKKKDLPLPPKGCSMAMAVHRLEEISCAIRENVTEKAVRAEDDHEGNISLKDYPRFRRRAYELLAYYADHGLQPAFLWLLKMKGQAPRRIRGSVRGNDFHLGLLAMTAGAGQFMHRNRLRELAEIMHEAHLEHIGHAEINAFVTLAKKRRRAARVLVSPERARIIQQNRRGWSG